MGSGDKTVGSGKLLRTSPLLKKLSACVSGPIQGSLKSVGWERTGEGEGHSEIIGQRKRTKWRMNTPDS